MEQCYMVLVRTQSTHFSEFIVRNSCHEVFRSSRVLMFYWSLILLKTRLWHRSNWALEVTLWFSLFGAYLFNSKKTEGITQYLH